MYRSRLPIPSLLLAWLIATAIGSAQADDPAYLTYLNDLRAQAGMTPLTTQADLAQAAASHAQYLTTNQLTGHNEDPADPGFTGVTAAERVVAAGYPSRSVSENISSGPDQDHRDSIDDLMSAIYHRHGFLAFDKDEIGGAESVYADGSTRTWVYNMGNSQLRAVCAGPEFSGSGTYYRGVCEPDIGVGADAYEGAIAAVQGENPTLVVWPPEHGTDIPPAFFEESPDPLPDYSVSGYPVSVLFNPHEVDSAGLSRLQLFRDADNHPIDNVREMNTATDPNGRFDGLQYALFPLQRLDWNSRYRVEVDYTQDGVNYSKQWTFTTRDPGVPVYTIANGERIEVASGTALAAYVPPTTAYPTLSDGGGIGWRYSSGMTVAVDFLDLNTLRIEVSGKDGDQASLTYNGAEGFVVAIVDEVVSPPTPSVLDIDGNGAVETERDLRLLLRYLFGFRGERLIYNVIDPVDCTRCRLAEIAPYLQAHRAEFDIDGNGRGLALSDGLLLLRYQADWRGDVLLAGVVDREGCTRCDAAAIEDYIAGLLAGG